VPDWRGSYNLSIALTICKGCAPGDCFSAAPEPPHDQQVPRDGEQVSEGSQKAKPWRHHSLVSAANPMTRTIAKQAAMGTFIFPLWPFSSTENSTKYPA